ncbi:hypothetical protein Hanom_Chr06g00528401 [Helianthus anomalus]
MFGKEIHCMAIKREYSIQKFQIAAERFILPFYDVAALTKLELIISSNFEGATLFARNIKMKKRNRLERRVVQASVSYLSANQVHLGSIDQHGAIQACLSAHEGYG